MSNHISLDPLAPGIGEALRAADYHHSEGAAVASGAETRTCAEQEPSLALLSALFPPDALQAGALTIWDRKTHATSHFDDGDLHSASMYAREHASDRDLYFGCALRRFGLASTKRGGKADVTVLTAVWVDIDVVGPGHAHSDGAPDFAEAHRLLDGLPLEPSAVVNTGGGLHAYWFLDVPWLLPHDADRELADRLVKDWNLVVQLHAESRGWSIDLRAGELARVLRLPGTRNHKTDESRPVVLEHLDHARRYSRQTIEVCLDRTLPAVAWEAAKVPKGKPVDRRADTRAASWWSRVVRVEAEALAAMPKNSGRNSQLNASAFKLGCIADELHRRGHSIADALGDAKRALIAACRSNSLVTEDGQTACEESFMSGWNGASGQRLHSVTIPDFSSHDNRLLKELHRESVHEPDGSVPSCPPKQHDYDDIGNAERLASLYGDCLKYCTELGSWLSWDGRRWQVDSGLAAQHYAKLTARSIAVEASQIESVEERNSALRWARLSGSRQRIKAMVDLVRDNLAVDVSDLDTHGYLLNCLNGIVDLRTGELHPHDPSKLLTKLAPVNYVPEAHRREGLKWSTFLTRFTGGDAELARWLQAAMGCSLVGAAVGEFLVVLCGRARTGKTKLLETVGHVLGMGEYATKVDIALLLAGRRSSSSAASPELAKLRGVRFAFAEEANHGDRLDAGRINELTGSTTITGRPLYANAITFERQFTIMIATNYAPGTDAGPRSGLWSRWKVVRAENVIPEDERVENYDMVLFEEDAEAILAWLVEGAARFLESGLPPAQPSTTRARSTASRMTRLASGSRTVA